MAHSLSLFPVLENETGPRKQDAAVGGGNEVKFALFDRSNVALKKTNSRSATPKKALNFNRMTLPVRKEKEIVRREKSLNLSDIDDDEDETDATEPVEAINPSEAEVTDAVADDEDQGFDENQDAEPEKFNLLRDSNFYYSTAYVPFPSDNEFPRMIRKDVDFMEDVDENGHPMIRPLNDSYLDLHTAMDHVEEVDYGFAWTDEEIDGRSSGVCDLLTDDDENDDSL